eukprot:gene9729-10722_t
MATVDGIEDDLKEKHVQPKKNSENLETTIFNQINGEKEEDTRDNNESCKTVKDDSDADSLKDCKMEVEPEKVDEDVEMCEFDQNSDKETKECNDIDVKSELNSVENGQGNEKIEGSDTATEMHDHCETVQNADGEIKKESTLQNGSHNHDVNQDESGESKIGENFVARNSESTAIKTENNQYKDRKLEDEVDSINSKESISTDNLKQETILKKLGFDPIKKISLEKLCSQSDNESNESKIVNKALADVKETLQGEIDDVKSAESSRCSSPGNLVNGIVNEKVSNSKRSKILEQKSVISTLKEDLRIEEAQLLLLRKLMDSQSRSKGHMNLHKAKENNARHVNMPSLHSKNRMSNHGYAGNQDGNMSSIQIAPKIVIGSKGSAVGSNLPRVIPSIVSAGNSSTGTALTSSIDAPRVTYSQMHGSVPSSSVIAQPGHRYYIQVGSQLVPAAPPTCINQPVYAMPAAYSTAASTASKPKLTASSSTPALCKSATQHVNSVDTQASKHSAAKAALRRQLEQTLLQIPPPRPPEADWRVIPNVNSMDFMMLIGLDETVDMILECDGKPTLKRVLTDMLPGNPIICDQCGMDFSPLWKHRGSSKQQQQQAGVLCEKCSLANTKKELKAEHTSRLKSAFLLALKQEQEIEEKIKAGEDVNIGSPTLQQQPPQEKPLPSNASVSHHKVPPSHVHSVHQPYKYQKVAQKSSDRHHPVAHHHHHHGVVQHYPHHSPLVHQLHQQHIQQVDYEPTGSAASGSSAGTSSRRNARWHPYHHGSSHVHGMQHHRTYTGSSSRSDGRHEYYVVHHPQHSNSTRWGH